MAISDTVPLKDTHKGHMLVSREQKNRQDIILAFVRNNKGVSIKDIRQLADPAIRGCSEKTIQRELGELIRRGLIKKVGERRWSQYLPL